MGSDLIQKKEAQPIFVAWAQKEDKNGAPLQKIQIIKVGTTIVGENKQMKRSTI